MTTKKQILVALRREHLSVADLCKRLGVTRNAVNVQIRQLQAEGLVRAVPIRRQGRLGKPTTVYEAAPLSEDISSSAYQPFLASLVEAVAGRLGPEVLADMLEGAGRQMARRAGLSNPESFDAGLRAAMTAADALGATTEAVWIQGNVMVRNYSCPVGTLARSEPCVCRAFAAFFAEATGCPVSEHCLRDERLICQYLIERGDSTEHSLPAR